VGNSGSHGHTCGKLSEGTERTTASIPLLEADASRDWSKETALKTFLPDKLMALVLVPLERSLAMLVGQQTVVISTP
jgi:hypothetical protein